MFFASRNKKKAKLLLDDALSIYYSGDLGKPLSEIIDMICKDRGYSDDIVNIAYNNLNNYFTGDGSNIKNKEDAKNKECKDVVNSIINSDDIDVFYLNMNKLEKIISEHSSSIGSNNSFILCDISEDIIFLFGKRDLFDSIHSIFIENGSIRQVDIAKALNIDSRIISSAVYTFSKYGFICRENIGGKVFVTDVSKNKIF